MSTDPTTARRMSAIPVIALPALALSIGWGVRGNYGHEHGAMLPGALAAMAAVLVIDRADWRRRIAFFGLFGAIGWAFGGSMSYGHVLSYSHAPDALNCGYGFACLYVIGFLWGAIGGAATALPALLTRERLTAILPPALWFFGVLILHDLTYDPLNVWLADALQGRTISGSSAFRQDEPLYWFDTDWTTALVAVLVGVAYRAVRRKADIGSSIILHMAIGWLASFLVFPVLLGWRMTPPRGDNWAGCLGAMVGLWVFLQRNRLQAATLASVVTGIVGGVGFAGATAMQILWLRTGWETNWHSVLEQTYGLINGIGLGLSMLLVARAAAPVSDDPPARRWTDWFAPAFVLLGVIYLNARKNPEAWIDGKAMPALLYALQPITWFNIGYLALAGAVLFVMIRHMRRPVPVIPATWAGKGQMLMLMLLWWTIVMNFEKAIPGFAPQRLITEGVIFLNACLVTVLVTVWTAAARVSQSPPEAVGRWLRRSTLLVAPVAVACVLACMAARYAAFGAEAVQFRSGHLRFGPHATADTQRPAPGRPHP